jgi:hypothetical protein
MVRPERTGSWKASRSGCVELAGESPVAVSVEAPRSRSRVRREIGVSEWDVKGPQRVIRLAGGRQVRRPSIKRTLQPREIKNRKVGQAEPLMSRRRQQTASGFGATQDARGVWRRACGQSSTRNRRDPSWPQMSVNGETYKPKVKGSRAGRESEGFVVPWMPPDKGGGGKEPCFGHGRVWR